MLQWMGGSRRKVTTASMIGPRKRGLRYISADMFHDSFDNGGGPQTRRSTQNRQKQYFEQRKRRQLALNLECYDDEKHKQTQYCGDRPSLDIASLANLATLTQECQYNDMTNEQSSICNRVEIISPKKFVGATHPDNEPSTHKKSSSINNDKADKKNVSIDKPLSVFDLLGDDEFYGPSEGRSTQEAHVAFSVEGLGKIGTETPVHSPKQLRSPPKIPLISRCAMSTSEVPNCSPRGFMPNTYDSFDDFLSDKWKFCCSMEEKDNTWDGNFFPDKTWDGGSSFLDDSVFNDTTYGLTWKSQTFPMDNGFQRDKTQEIFDYDFEDQFLLNRRHVGERHNKPIRMSDLWQLDSPLSSLQHLPSEKENGFKAFNGGRGGRYPEDFQCLDPKIELFNDYSHSFFGSEDSMDSMSLLSEESCSSSTVRGDQTRKPTSELFSDRARDRNHDTELHMDATKKMKNISVATVKLRKLGKVHEEDTLKDVRNYDRSNFLWFTDAQPLKGHASVKRTLEPLERSFFEDGGMSDIAPIPQLSSGAEFTSFGGEFWSVEDICGPYPSTTRTHPRVQSSPEKSKSKSKCIGSDSFRSAENVVKEQSVDHLPLTETQPINPSCTPDCQGDIEEVSATQPIVTNVSEGLKKDMPVVETDLSSVSAKDEEITNAKDRYNESEKEKEGKVEVIDNPEMGKSLVSAQEILTGSMEIPARLVKFTRDTEHHKDAGINLYSKNGNRVVDAERETSKPELKICGKGQSHVEQSYEMMLESYVLQLLCVRKVLEASENNPVKEA